MRDERIGEKFGKITILEKDPKRKYYYWCKCECGNEKYFLYYHLKNGLTKSCGCRHKSKTYTEVGEVLQDLKETLKKLGYIPSSKEYKNILKISTPSFYLFKKFNLHYTEALKAIGFPSYGTGPKIIDRYRVCMKRGCYNCFIPNHDAGVIILCYQCSNIEEPSKEEQIKKAPKPKKELIDKNDLISDIRTFIKENPINATMQQYKISRGPARTNMIQRELGGWNSAVKQAINIEDLVVDNFKSCSKNGVFDAKEYRKNYNFPSWTYIKDVMGLNEILEKANLTVTTRRKKPIYNYQSGTNKSIFF